MREVLILGNGISRLLHEDLIESWEGELWGCNYIYKEFGDRLDRLTGHVSVLAEALQYREEHGCHFELWFGGLGAFPEGAGRDYCKKFTSRREHHKDSGTTIVSQALEEAFDRILVCGFDLGGRDIYTKNLHQTNKQSWIDRWRGLKKGYPREFEAIEFVGYDHKPFIEGAEDRATYVRRYKRGRPHIPDPEYVALYALCYGDSFYRHDRGEDPVVKVRYIGGPRAGWETMYNEKIAIMLANKGTVEIIDEAPPEDEVDELIDAKVKVTSRMNLETLHKIADLRGLEGYEELTKKELRERLTGEPVDPDAEKTDEAPPELEVNENGEE